MRPSHTWNKKEEKDTCNTTTMQKDKEEVHESGNAFENDKNGYIISNIMLVDK